MIRTPAIVGAALLSLCVSTAAFAQTPPPEPKRPSIVMLSAYTVTAIVQGLDAHSTFKALDAGGVEVNPFLFDVAKNRPAFIALKAGVAAGLIYAGHGIARKHKVVSVLTLAAINSVYIGLAANNYRAAKKMK